MCVFPVMLVITTILVQPAHDAVPLCPDHSTTHIKCPKLTDLRNFRNIQFYTEMPTTKIKIKMSVILFRKILYCIYTEGINEITQKTRDGTN